MYDSNGIYYSEEHTVSFGDLVTKSSGGINYTDFNTYANSWEDWHLIPSSLPVISNPGVVTKYVEIPGADGALDLSEFLSGRTSYSQRQGTLSFIMDNNQEDPESIRLKMMGTLHGKRIKMNLMDEPSLYYEGRFSVGNIDSRAEYPAITITYQLDPFKYHIQPHGSEPLIWDTFNFEEDYDYSIMYPYITVSGTTKSYRIDTNGCPVTPTATWVSGSLTVSYGGVTRTLTSAGTVTLGTRSSGYSNLSVSGTGSVKIEWRGGSL